MCLIRRSLIDQREHRATHGLCSPDALVGSHRSDRTRKVAAVIVLLPHELKRFSSRRGNQIERKCGQRLSVICTWDRYPGGDHVRVTDGLDFLDTVTLGNFVERADEAVQKRNGLFRPEAAGHADETDDVGEKHRCLGEAVGDRLAGTGLEALDDVIRQDIAQNSILRVGDMVYLPKEKRFVAMANRFDWARANAAPARTRTNSSDSLERRRAGLRFERVNSAKVHGLDFKDKRAALALLAVTFEPASPNETPEGDVTLTFSGGAAIRLSVECIEAELKDFGAAWTAKRSPKHPEDAS